MTNKYAGTCNRCGKHVEERKGQVYFIPDKELGMFPNGVKYLVQHNECAVHNGTDKYIETLIVAMIL